jgi:penicillin amidase
MGSNNWVLAGSRTASGKPILANDMHLPLTAPAIWYENHLVSTDQAAPLDVSGITFPGVPYVVAGHNGRVAWGFTNGFPDVQDLYMERLRRTPGGVQFEYDNEWHDAEVRKEEIGVKGGSSFVQEVIVTRHTRSSRPGPGLTTGMGSTACLRTLARHFLIRTDGRGLAA